MTRNLGTAIAVAILAMLATGCMHNQVRGDTIQQSLENVVDTATQTPSPGTEPNTYKVTRSAAYRLIGFSTDSEAGTVPSGIQLLLQGGGRAYTLPAQGGLERSDVAAFFKKPGLANAGYQADAGFANVQPGTYEVFAVNTFEGTRVLCPTHQSVIID